MKISQGRTEKHPGGLTENNIYGGGTMNRKGTATERYTYVATEVYIEMVPTKKKAVFNV